MPNPEKFAQMLVDFITFMHNKGHVINVIALDKESVRMGIDGFKVAVDTLRARTKRLDYEVPKIVAPELLDPQGNIPCGYMNTLYNKGFQNSYDIFGDHYYQRDHTVAGFAKLKYEFDLAQSDKTRPQWATEPHWNGDGELYAAESALGVTFDHTDLGLEAFMWWGYPITGSTKFNQPVMRAYSDAILRSAPIRMVDHDGEETFTQGKLHSRAYLRGIEVNVFLINVVNPNVAGLIPISYHNYVIGILNNFSVDGKATVRQWREDTNNDTTTEGEISTLDPTKNNQLLVDLPIGSVTQITFK
ncbi:hypothetical protein, partial [Arcticibacter svalbardensis]|uniref:hypothetical protein n=1 Tax=Arcticibacter svalbardensis TaxID=1288027 RepID=UPI0012690A68